MVSAPTGKPPISMILGSMDVVILLISNSTLTEEARRFAETQTDRPLNFKKQIRRPGFAIVIVSGADGSPRI